MEIKIYLEIPSKYERVNDIKTLIGSSKVDAFSLDKKGKIIEGKGWVASDESYNYHNNYDDSKDVLFFNGKQQWFTCSRERIEEVYNINKNIIVKRLNEILENL